MAELATCVLGLTRSEDQSELDPFFANVEGVLATADDEGRDLPVVGLLEGLQNAVLNDGEPGLSTLATRLGPEGKRYWAALIRHVVTRLLA